MHVFGSISLLGLRKHLFSTNIFLDTLNTALKQVMYLKMFNFTVIIYQQMGSSGSWASVSKTADTKASHCGKSSSHPPHNPISYFLRITLILSSNILQIFHVQTDYIKNILGAFLDSPIYLCVRHTVPSRFHCSGDTRRPLYLMPF